MLAIQSDTELRQMMQGTYIYHAGVVPTVLAESNKKKKGSIDDDGDDEDFMDFD